MKEYLIIILKKKYALHFFHKGDIVYRFMKDVNERNENEFIINQFNHITLRWQQQELVKVLKERLPYHMKLTIQDQLFEIKDDQHIIKINYYPSYLKVSCKSIYGLEKLLFPVLKTYSPYLFVVNFSLEHFGWITPINNYQFKHHHEKLYSYP